MSLYGVKYGRKVVVHGHLGFKINGKLQIGSYCYISSGKDLNPLCAKDEGFIRVEKDAKLIIGDECAMSSPRIWAFHEILIGDHVMMGGNVTIVDSDCHSLNYRDRRYKEKDREKTINLTVCIENDVFVGMNTIILKGVTIGARSIIGAGSVVTSNIPSDCIAAGNPAKVIKQISKLVK